MSYKYKTFLPEVVSFFSTRLFVDLNAIVPIPPSHHRRETEETIVVVLPDRTLQLTTLDIMTRIQTTVISHTTPGPVKNRNLSVDSRRRPG